LILERTAALPSVETVVAVGPTGMPDVELDARRSGADVYLGRPIQPRQLAMALERLDSMSHPRASKSP